MTRLGNRNRTLALVLLRAGARPAADRRPRREAPSPGLAPALFLSRQVLLITDGRNEHLVFPTFLTSALPR